MSTSTDPLLLQSLKRHLEGLKRTEAGLALYNQIQRVLQKYGHADGSVELGFVIFLHDHLGKYAASPLSDPAARVKARLIQQRLMPYMSDVSLSSLLSAPVVPSSHAVSAEQVSVVSPSVVAPPVVSEPVSSNDITVVVPESGLPLTRQEQKEALSDALAEKVTESIAVDKQFAEQQGRERDTSQSVHSPLGELGDLKQMLVKGMNELIEERQVLIDKLSSASEFIQAVEADRERLRQELGQARQHSMTDELTGLPRREVFIKQLESEIGRARRYGFALAVAVIDVDGLESINKRYGRATGDAVLRCYAREILSRFRTYDLVARYGADEFAVLFPNTQKDGAMQALEKARKAATSTFIQFEGRNLPLPSFSSVLTQYAPGEPAGALLTRADETLAHAKRGGHDRMVVALPVV